MRRNGGKHVRVTGKRGLWRVCAKMPVGSFTHFCAIEAARDEMTRKFDESLKQHENQETDK